MKYKTILSLLLSVGMIFGMQPAQAVTSGFFCKKVAPKMCSFISKHKRDLMGATLGAAVWYFFFFKKHTTAHNDGLCDKCAGDQAKRDQ